MLGRDLGFDAAPRLSVTGDDDGASDRNAKPVEFVVILGPAVVHVHERRRHVAVDGVRVVARQLLALLARRRIDRHRGLFESCREFRGLHEFEQALLRGGKEHVELLDRRVPAPFLELRHDPFGVVLVVRRADMMRPRAQALHVGLEIRRLRQGPEGLVPGFGARLRRGRRGPKREDEHQGEDSWHRTFSQVGL